VIASGAAVHRRMILAHSAKSLSRGDAGFNFGGYLFRALSRIIDRIGSSRTSALENFCYIQLNLCSGNDDIIAAIHRRHKILEEVKMLRQQ